MKKLLSVLSLISFLGSLLILPGAASAKPLGNFKFKGHVCFGAETYTFKKGWNLFSSPYKLWQKNPKKFFVDTKGKKIPLDGNLIRWDEKTQKDITYRANKPKIFGNLKYKEAYWLYVEKDRTVMVSGICSQKDEKIALTTGWDTFGYPFRENQISANLLIRNKQTGEIISMSEANDKGWITSAMMTWNADDQGEYDTCAPDSYCIDSLVNKWQGYKFNVFRDNLELIIPKVK